MGITPFFIFRKQKSEKNLKQTINTKI